MKIVFLLTYRIIVDILVLGGDLMGYQYKRIYVELVSLYLKELHVKPNTTYRFSADVCGGPISVYLSKRGICGNSAFYHSPDTDAWATLSFEFTTNDDEEAVHRFADWGIAFARKAEQNPDEPRDAYVDNVCLAAVDEPNVNLIDGGTFEEKVSSVYDKNWNSEILGLSGRTFGISITSDPANPQNHCLKLPSDLLTHHYPNSLPLKVEQLRSYQELTTDVTEEMPNIDNQFLILIAKNGEIPCTVNGTSYTIPRNALIIAPPYANVSYLCRADANAEYYLIRFGGTDATKLLRDLGITAPSVITVSNVTALTDIIVQMLSLPSRNRTYFYSVSGLLQLFLAELETQIVTAPPHSRYRGYIKAIADQMSDRPELTITNDEMAAACGISKSHFINLFKEQNGCTPKQYRLQALIRKACTLLSTTTMNVQEVAYTLGMNDPLYFSRLFRSVQGISPREYQRTHRSDGS